MCVLFPTIIRNSLAKVLLGSTERLDFFPFLLFRVKCPECVCSFSPSFSFQIELKLQLKRDNFQRGIEFLVLFSIITVVTFLLFIFSASPLFAAVSNSYKVTILQNSFHTPIGIINFLFDLCGFLCFSFSQNVTKTIPRGNPIPSFPSSIPSVRLAHTTCLNSNKSVRQK